MNNLKYKNKNSNSGFTLIETLVVASIITLIMSSILALVKGTQEKAKRTVALANQRQLQKAVELYYNDMGFYPPDVNRGWDPGISKALPSNSDLNKDCATNSADCPVCLTCPADWVDQVRAKWQGPYTASWPNTAPWGGKYDFNNWNTVTTRYGCQVPPGVYIGTQRNYDESNPIPYLSEKWFFDNQQDADNCINGESQLQLIRY
jgi:prepilin-type N-terminal cleavage/methylation domain-containing protein